MSGNGALPRIAPSAMRCVALCRRRSHPPEAALGYTRGSAQRTITDPHTDIGDIGMDIGGILAHAGSIPAHDDDVMSQQSKCDELAMFQCKTNSRGRQRIRHVSGRLL